VPAPQGDDISIAPPGGNDTFGASFTGFLLVPDGGDVNFTVGVDDAMELLVNGESVVRFIGVTDFRIFQGTATDLPAGFVPITLNYAENGGEADIVLSAEGGGLPGGVILPEFLFTAIPTGPDLPRDFVSPPGDFSSLRQDIDETFTRRFKDGTVFHFDAEGRQTSVVDRNGNANTYSYEADGRLIEISDAVGRITAFSYSGTYLSSVVDPAGRTTQFEHDAAGNLTRIIDTDGSSREFRYDEQHRLISQTSKRSFDTQYTYDFAGSNVLVSHPDGSTRLISPSATVGLVDLESGLGSPDNPAPVVRPEDAVATYVDGAGNATMFATDRFGSATVTIDPLGRQTTATRDLNGNSEEMISPNGTRTSTAFDERGNLLSVREALGTSLEREVRFEYESLFHQLIRAIDPAGNETTVEYDAQGNPVRFTDPLGGVRTQTFDSRGLLLSSTNANGATVTFSYDTLGNLGTITDALGRVTTFTRSAAGNVTGVTEAAGTPDERKTSFTYDALNRVLSATDELGATTEFRYDADGGLLETEIPTGQVVSQEYDALSRVVRRNDPIGGTTELT
jgi:YD repeat-containing protein